MRLTGTLAYGYIGKLFTWEWLYSLFEHSALQAVVVLSLISRSLGSDWAKMFVVSLGVMPLS